MFRTKQSGKGYTLNSLRTEFQKLLKFEKRQSFNTYLKETAETEDVKTFYSLLKRLSPKFKCNVKSDFQRAEFIASELIQFENDSAYTGFYETTALEQSELSIHTRDPNPKHFSIIEWNMAIQYLKNWKSLGPDSMTYENWKAWDPKMVPFMARAFSETFTSGRFHPEWFLFYVKPLSKKPGKPEVRSISHLKSILNIMGRLLLLKMLQWIQENQWLQTFNLVVFQESHQPTNYVDWWTIFSRRNERHCLFFHMTWKAHMIVVITYSCIASWKPLEFLMNGDHTSFIFCSVERSKFWVTPESPLPGLCKLEFLKDCLQHPSCWIFTSMKL